MTTISSIGLAVLISPLANALISRGSVNAAGATPGSGGRPTPHDTSQAARACQADGATLSTAMAAFEAENPGVTPTETLLTDGKDGGPYLENWAHNPPIYAYKINSAGTLLISIPTNTKWVTFKGPSSCKKLKGVTLENIRAIDACQADGATVTVAMEAFAAENPGVTPTETLLTDGKDGGPYIESWPKNAPLYDYRISSAGRLLISIPSNTKWVAFLGASSCAKLL